MHMHKICGYHLGIGRTFWVPPLIYMLTDCRFIKQGVHTQFQFPPDTQNELCFATD